MVRSAPIKEVVLFFSITLGLAFLVFWGPLAIFGISAISFVSNQRGPLWAVILYLSGGFVPSIVGLVLAAGFGGGAGIRALLRRVVQFKIGWRDCVAIPTLIAMATAGQILLNRWLGNRFDFRLFLTQTGSLLPLIIIGPLSEELGWRGFALDRLQVKLSGLTSALIVGVIWGTWHLPLFLIPGTSQQVLAFPFVGFLLGVTSVSVVMTLFHNRTRGSVLTAVYFHWIYTYSAQVTATGVTKSTAYNWLEYVRFVVAAVVVVLLFGKTLGRKVPVPETVVYPG